VVHRRGITILVHHHQGRPRTGAPQWATESHHQATGLRGLRHVAGRPQPGGQKTTCARTRPPAGKAHNPSGGQDATPQSAQRPPTGPRGCREGETAPPIRQHTNNAPSQTVGRPPPRPLLRAPRRKKGSGKASHGPQGSGYRGILCRGGHGERGLGAQNGSVVTGRAPRRGQEKKWGGG